jgi:cytoskeletal protein RodZ
MRDREPGQSRGSASAADSVKERPEEQGSFGQYLQTIRIEKHIRLEQVAEETRIGVSILEALEHEDLARLPPEVFTIGFLRAYAAAVGADGGEAVRRYRVQQRLRQKALESGRRPEASPSKLAPRLVLTLAFFAALVAASLIAFQHWNRTTPSSAPAPSPPIADVPASPPAERAVDPMPSEAVKKPAIPQSPKHVLTIVALENSWVKVVIDQGTAAEHKLKAGDQLRLVAQSSFNLLIGNVGGVKMNLNDQPLTVPGKRGEVVNLHLP